MSIFGGDSYRKGNHFNNTTYVHISVLMNAKVNRIPKRRKKVEYFNFGEIEFSILLSELLSLY